MRIEPLRRLSVWATLTGLLLVGLLAIQLAFSLPRADSLVMLLASVVGFEMFLSAQELAHRVRRRG